MSFALPVRILRTTHEIRPNIIPVAIEYVNGITTIAKNAPIVSATSPSNETFLIDVSIKRPTKIIAGAVANEGIARNIGDKTSERRNKTAVTTEVRPVLPPAETPALDST